MSKRTVKPSITSIRLIKVHSSERADRIKACLHGKSFMDLQVEVCPFQGELHVSVSTLLPRTSVKALTDMVMGILAAEIAAR